MGRRQLYLHQGLLLPCREEPGEFYTASLGAMLISLSDLEGFERLGLPEQQDACEAAHRPSSLTSVTVLSFSWDGKSCLECPAIKQSLVS